MAILNQRDNIVPHALYNKIQDKGFVVVVVLVRNLEEKRLQA